MWKPPNGHKTTLQILLSQDVLSRRSLCLNLISSGVTASFSDCADKRQTAWNKLSRAQVLCRSAVMMPTDAHTSVSSWCGSQGHCFLC